MGPRLREWRNAMTPTCFIRKLGTVLVTLLLYGGTSHAQSVADTARQSRAKQQSETGRSVFTNADAPTPAAIPTATAPSITQPVRNGRHEIPYDPYEGST